MKAMTPIEVDDANMAFGGCGIGMKKLLPAYDTLPDEFRSRRSPYCRLVSEWFFSVLDKKKLKVKDGVDETAAWRHMKTIMGSFEPKHEHKEAGVAYLMSQWFDLTATMKHSWRVLATQGAKVSKFECRNCGICKLVTPSGVLPYPKTLWMPKVGKPFYGAAPECGK